MAPSRAAIIAGKAEQVQLPGHKKFYLRKSDWAQSKADEADRAVSQLRASRIDSNDWQRIGNKQGAIAALTQESTKFLAMAARFRRVGNKDVTQPA